MVLQDSSEEEASFERAFSEIEKRSKQMIEKQSLNEMAAVVKKANQLDKKFN